MKTLFFSLIFTCITLITYAQDNDSVYFKVDSIARKVELNVISKGVDYMLILDAYGKTGQASSVTTIYRIGKAHFIEQIKLNPNGTITKQEKQLKTIPLFTDIERIKKDTLTKPQPYSVDYASHFALMIKLQKERIRDMFDAADIGKETTYLSTEVFVMVEKLLKQYKFMK